LPWGIHPNASQHLVLIVERDYSTATSMAVLTHFATPLPAANALTAHRPGRSLAGAVQARRRPLVEARSLLVDALRGNPKGLDAFAAIFAVRSPNQFTDINPRSVAERAAWALVNMYLLGAAAGAPISDSVKAAEAWFLGSRAQLLPSLAGCLDTSTDRACAVLLSVVTIDRGFRGLLPYVLEPFDFAHRMSAMRCAESGKQRKQKRSSGTFYTPGDVATTIAQRAAGSVPTGGRAIDPACGTGVFLLALLRELQKAGDARTPFQICGNSLYGIDVSDLAVESCAFVLAHECLDQIKHLDPWAVWQTIRLNLWATDTTRIRLSSNSPDATERKGARNALSANKSTPTGFVGKNEIETSLWRESDPMDIWSVFPEAAGGFEAIVANPPYVRTTSEAGNLYIRFVEQMIRLARPARSFIGAVLPLSVAFASDDETRTLRLALTRDSGSCRFAFFDREPHGLFGEEVKTRSAILLRQIEPGTGPAVVQTTSLLRLTSRSRATLLECMPAVTLGQQDIRDRVPKLGSDVEVDAYNGLITRRFRNSDLRFSAAPFTSCLGDASDDCIYVGPVAYNFINVARRLELLPYPEGTPTSSKFLRCELTDSATADAIFALFSSRVSYWLWNVRGDGFHVSKRFVENISTFWGDFPASARAVLAGKGKELWASVRQSPIVSRNAGAWSVAFSPLPYQTLLTEIDAIVSTHLELPEDFVALLRRAAVERIVVSPDEKKRRELVG
jgi:hypothetical protein